MKKQEPKESRLRILATRLFYLTGENGGSKELFALGSNGDLNKTKGKKEEASSLFKGSG